MFKCHVTVILQLCMLLYDNYYAVTGESGIQKFLSANSLYCSVVNNA